MRHKIDIGLILQILGGITTGFLLTFLLAQPVKADETIVADAPFFESQKAENPYQTLVISDREFEELRWVVALEAQGEGFIGECAVVEVIFNRALSEKDWGDSIHEVLSKKGQFATYKRIGKKSAWARPGEMEDDAISEVLRRGPSILPSMHYVFFDSKGGVNGRNHYRLGNHTFGEERV